MTHGSVPGFALSLLLFFCTSTLFLLFLSSILIFYIHIFPSYITPGSTSILAIMFICIYPNAFTYLYCMSVSVWPCLQQTPRHQHRFADLIRYLVLLHLCSVIIPQTNFPNLMPTSAITLNSNTFYMPNYYDSSTIFIMPLLSLYLYHLWTGPNFSYCLLLHAKNLEIWALIIN